MKIPLWIKVAYTLLVAVILPTYWIEYGPINFLWFSDIALILMVPALWFENKMIASMTALSVLLLELCWIIDFAAGGNLFGLSRYMFDSSITLHVRLLSLFHILLPLLILYVLSKIGYVRRALSYQIAFMLLILAITYSLADPNGENINWVFGLGEQPQTSLHPLVYLSILMLAMPIVIYLPSHLILKRVFKVI